MIARPLLSQMLALSYACGQIEAATEAGPVCSRAWNLIELWGDNPYGPALLVATRAGLRLDFLGVSARATKEEGPKPLLQRWKGHAEDKINRFTNGATK